MLRQMRESTLCQTVPVRVASKTQDTVFRLAQMPLCVMMLTSCPPFISQSESFQMVRQVGCRYFVITDLTWNAEYKRRKQLHGNGDYANKCTEIP